MRCFFGHDWSKYHILRTYAGTVTETRVCMNCGIVHNNTTSISLIVREDLRELWANYHTPMLSAELECVNGEAESRL